jgi:hypothetical protein
MGIQTFIEDIGGGVLTPLCRRHDKLCGDGRLAGTRRAKQQRAGSAVEAATQQGIQLRHTAGDSLPRKVLVMFSRDEARIDGNPAGLNIKIMVAAPIFAATEFDDAEAAPLRSVFQCQMFKCDHAVRDASDL